MERFARGKWTDKQILDALRARSGSQEIYFKANVLQNGIKTREIALSQESTVSVNTDDEITRTARLDLYEKPDELKEEISPYMLLRMEDAKEVSSIRFKSFGEWDKMRLTWRKLEAHGLRFADDAAGTCEIDWETAIAQYAEFPLGIFILSTPTRTSEDGVNTWSIEAYDRTLILKEDGFDTTLYLAAGERYLDVVMDILVSAGIENVMIADYVDTALPADREIEIGKSKLEAVNELLKEINFSPIYCDTQGRFILEAYREPSPERIDFTYAEGELSVIERDTETETDYYGVPNVFIAVCSNPDLDQDYKSVYINDNPASPYSTVRRGRRIVSEIFRLEQIASQADLDAYVRRMAYERTQGAGETVTFNTALMPVHGREDNIALKHPDASGSFCETGWTLQLSADGKMEHTVKRMVII